MASLSSASAPTPSSSTSNRRSSISSVTSSRRRRKDQSLLDVALSLGQHTPERSQTSDEGVPTRFRQLDFGSADGGDVDNKQAQEKLNEVDASNGEGDEDGEARGGGEVQAERMGDADPVRAHPRGRAIRGRRQTIFWSADEEEFLRSGVDKYGVGKWKKILVDGRDVFSRHRTNVDLKDKWKNMQTPGHTSRKRRREPDNLTPSPEHEEKLNVQHAPEVSVKRSRPSSDDVSEKSPAESAPRPVKANQTTASAVKKTVALESLPDEEDEDYPGKEEGADPNGLATSGSDQLSGPIVLKFATDKCFREFVEVPVGLDTCKDVSALKELLQSSILSDTPPDAEIQMIGLKSRLLFEDDEHLSRCIRKNGVEFFLVFEENPEEFV